MSSDQGGIQMQGYRVGCEKCGKVVEGQMPGRVMALEACIAWQRMHPDECDSPVMFMHVWELAPAITRAMLP